MRKFKGVAYLAGPVRSLPGGRAEGIEIRELAEDFLNAAGFTTFNPPGAWSGDVNNEHAEQALQALNDHIISVCSLVAVIMLPGVESKGTEHEVMLALRMGKPIYLLLPSPDGVSEFIAQLSRLVGESQTRVENEVTVFAIDPVARVYNHYYDVSYEPVREVVETV